MIKAVIFNFDGTLADTIDALREGINMTMEHYSFPLHTNEDIKRFINKGARVLVKLSLPEDKQSDEAFLDEALEKYRECYSKVYLHTDRAYDGIPETIEELKSRGIKLAVLSNKPDTFTRSLCESIFGNVFEIVLGAGDLPHKPDPAAALYIAETLGVKPCECAFVGDSDIDMKTAQNAGILPLGVAWGFRESSVLEAAGAAHVANVPSDIIKMIESEKDMDLKEKQLESTLIFDGTVVHLYKDKIELPNGDTSSREYIKHNGAVCVIPITDDGKVILERQYRYAVGEVLVEIPAGKLDYIGEDPHEAALRELREETGAVAAELIDLGLYYGSPAIMGEKIYMYMAKGLTYTEQELDRDEFLEVFTMPLEDAVKEVLAGNIPDGKTQAAILRAYMMMNK